MKKLLLFLTVLLAIGCKGSEDLLLGSWQVAVINRGGDVIGGRSFNGTKFTFGADGMVRTSGIEESSVAYRHENGLLVYENGTETETYRIDSLTEEVLVIFSDIDGVPTRTTMVRIGDLEQ